MAIVQDYLDLTKKYQTEYGEKTIVLMEVGSFYEVYALIKPDGSYTGTSAAGPSAAGPSAVGAGTETAVTGSPTYTGSQIEDFVKINEMVIAKKPNVFVGKLQVVMAGMGTAYAEKYIQKLQDHNYTIVIYKQDPINKTTRNLSEIISPGTYFPLDSVKLTNSIMCIWLYSSKAMKNQPSQITVGLANIDIYTGKTALFQYHAPYNHSPATYDELERAISAYKPSECLLVANLGADLLNDIIGFVGLEQTKMHLIDLTSVAGPTSASAAGPAGSASASVAGPASSSSLTTFVKNAEKQVYQIEILKKFFPQLSLFHFLPNRNIEKILSPALALSLFRNVPHTLHRHSSFLFSLRFCRSA